MHQVIRNFTIDYIYFDLIFLSLFVFFLIKRENKIPLFAFLIGGILIFLVDWGLWYHIMHIRSIILPGVFLPFFSDFFRKIIYMLWFSISYGIMFSWVFLMFEKKSRKIFWTLLLFGGWMLVALLSRWISLNESIISVTRNMATSRIVQIMIALCGYLILFLLKYNWKRILYLFFIGCAIHFFMEFTLWISGIRPSSIDLLIFNTLVEFNMGVPILYIFWDKFLIRKLKLNSET